MYYKYSCAVTGKCDLGEHLGLENGSIIMTSKSQNVNITEIYKNKLKDKAYSYAGTTL